MHVLAEAVPAQNHPSLSAGGGWDISLTILLNDPEITAGFRLTLKGSDIAQKPLFYRRFPPPYDPGSLRDTLNSLYCGSLTSVSVHMILGVSRESGNAWGIRLRRNTLMDQA